MQPRIMFCSLCALLFTSTCSHAQQWDWVQRFSSDSTGTAIGVDGNQNVYVAGTFTGTNYLGTNQFVSAGGNDVFLLKLNPEGEVVWAISVGGSGDDSIHRLAVATNGALFVVGNFSIPALLLAESVTNRSTELSNVFLARVDNGKFTWFDTLPPSFGLGSMTPADGVLFQSTVNGVGGLAFGPDESVWVIAATNAVFIRKYSQDGTVLSGYRVDGPSFLPNAIAVSRDEHVFISGRDANYTYFTAALDATGGIQWSWNAGYDAAFYEHNPIYAIACTPDCGVVSLVAVHSGFNWVGVILKHSGDGAVLWRRSESIYYKSVFSPRALAVDTHGNIHVIGRRVIHYLYPSLGDGLWLFSVDANGNRISESTIGNRRLSNPWNLGTGIAITPDGAIYITGDLTGTAFFGTNQVGGTGGAFVARRSTLQPELITERVGDNVILSWPRTAFPFALQQSDETGTNWSFVAQPPERIVVRWQVTLSAEQTVGMFRLFQTNEAIVRYPPRVIWLSQPESSFLRHSPAIVLAHGINAISRTFSAFVAADGPGGHITLDTLNADTGQPLAPAGSFPIIVDIYDNNIRSFSTGIRSGPIDFPTGEYNIALIVSDGVDHFTNVIHFEVITEETALQEFFATVEALSGDSAGRKAIAFVQAAMHAAERGREHLADKRWRNFQRQLSRISSLSDEERGRLSSAAGQVQSLLRAQ